MPCQEYSKKRRWCIGVGVCLLIAAIITFATAFGRREGNVEAAAKLLAVNSTESAAPSGAPSVFSMDVTGNVKDIPNFDVPEDSVLEDISVALEDANNNVAATTVTDSAGDYMFYDLPSGDYTAIVVLKQGSAAPSGAPTVYSMDITGNVQDIPNFDVPEDGVLEDISVALEDANGDVVATTVTDSAGDYMFYDLPSGDYTAIVVLKQGSAAPSGAPSVYSMDITGNVQDIPNFDVPEDGVLEGILIALQDANGNFVATTAETNSAGVYMFYDLPPGDYTAVVIPQGLIPQQGSAAPTGTPTRSAAPSGAPTVYSTDVTGNVKDISNFDVPEDNVLEDILVALEDPNGSVAATTVTDSAGDYIFYDLPSGDYTAVVVPKPKPLFQVDKSSYDCGGAIKVSWNDKMPLLKDDWVAIYPCHATVFYFAEVWSWICGDSICDNTDNASGEIIFDSLPAFNEDGRHHWPVAPSLNDDNSVNRCFKAVYMRSNKQFTGPPFEGYVMESEFFAIHETDEEGCSIIN